MKQFIEQQMAQRATAWEAAKKILDVATAEKRDLSAEETQTYERISKELDERTATIEKLRADEARELRLDAATREIADQVRPVADAPRAERNDNDVIRSMAKGEIRSHMFEKRDVVKTSTGSPVPTSFYDQVIMLARTVGPMLQTSTVLNTASGENLQIPSLAQYSTAAIVGEGTAISESDPVFNSFITLGAFKFSFLVQLSRELVEDSGVDILRFLADQTGNELGVRSQLGTHNRFRHKPTKRYRRSICCRRNWWNGCVGCFHRRQLDRLGLLSRHSRSSFGRLRLPDECSINRQNAQAQGHGRQLRVPTSTQRRRKRSASWIPSIREPRYGRHSNKREVGNLRTPSFVLRSLGWRNQVGSK